MTLVTIVAIDKTGAYKTISRVSLLMCTHRSPARSCCRIKCGICSGGSRN